jgi:hypothetical protein
MNDGLTWGMLLFAAAVALVPAYLVVGIKLRRWWLQ